MKEKTKIIATKPKKTVNPNTVGMPRCKKPWKKLSGRYPSLTRLHRADVQTTFKKDTWEQRVGKQKKEKALRQRVREVKEEHNKEVLRPATSS